VFDTVDLRQVLPDVPHPRSGNGGVPLSAPLSGPVRALAGAVEGVLAQVPTELPGAQALADTAELLRVIERLRGALLTRLGDVDTRRLHTLDGAGSISSWVAQQQTSTDRKDVALARRLAALPGLDQAVQAGALSIATAQRISRALGRLRPHVDRPDALIDGQPAKDAMDGVIVHGVLGLVCKAFGGLADDDPRLDALLADLVDIAGRPVTELARLEAAFVLLAQHVEPAQLPGALGQLTDALLPNELERRAEDAHRNRAFTIALNEAGSGWRVSAGELDLECGELLDTVLRTELAVDANNPADTAGYSQLRADGWKSGEELPSCGGPRSLRQRRHDALRNGLRRYLDAGLAGMRDKLVPHLSVTVGAETLAGAPGALPAVAASGARLPLSLVRSWVCDTAVTRFVLSLGGRVIETSHTERTLKAHERRAKHIETGGRCQGAGCTCRPGTRLIPHHIDPWAACGTTSLTDTALVCEQTHHDLHTENSPSGSPTADGSTNTA
jgi:hypothetical protein